MLMPLGQRTVHVVAGATDLRKAYVGLAILAERAAPGALKAGAVFAFCNGGRTRVRLLYFDGSGLWVATKRLEQGTYLWPQQGLQTVRAEHLAAMLGGLNVSGERPWYRLDAGQK